MATSAEPAPLPPGIEPLIEELRWGIEGVLGERLLGLYLYGSLVMGGFDPKLSDMDLLAVLASPLRDAEFEALRQMHSEFARRHPEWDDRVEVVYLGREALRTFRTERSPVTVISPGEPLNTKTAGIEWLMNWYLVRESGRALHGPPPATFIGPVSFDEFADSLRDHARSWPEWAYELKKRGAQAYAILTACRALYTIETGRQPSKEQAARWVQQRFTQWAGLMDEVLEWRRTMWEEAPDAKLTQAATISFLDWAAEQLSRE